MNCPNCGTPEQGRIRECRNCGTHYASEDLLELRQLEFLIAETAPWPEGEVRSKPYAERLAALKARILPQLPPAAAEVLPIETIAKPAPAAAVPSIEPASTPAAPEPVPFDQWLLSERNIKFALYSGGALLVLAGLIFVGVNWTRIPGPAKFAITLLITGLMYLGGYLLFQRPLLKLGGVALLGVASGFIPLNFVVLHIYIFGPRGLDTNSMWLIGSLPTLLLYVLTALWTRTDLFAYLSLGALASALASIMVLLNTPLIGFELGFTLLALSVLLGARASQASRFADFTRTPFLIVAQIAMPILFLGSVSAWLDWSGCTNCPEGSPWLALTVMLVGVIFYITTDLAFHWIIARWAAAFAFALTFVFLLAELNFSDTAGGITLMVLALLYLVAGYALANRVGQRSQSTPLFTAGYALAAFVTLQAASSIDADLAMVLVGDVILLIVSAWIHRRYEWVYGATWLFMAPVFIFASVYLRGSSDQGLALGVLMLNYAAAGYALGRRSLKLGGPFLTAAAFLSAAVILLTARNAVLQSVMLALIATLYLLAALWTGWSWLLLPALAAVNILVLSIWGIFSTEVFAELNSLTVTYAGLGVALALGGAWLRRAGLKAWAWPLYLAAALDLTGSYFGGLSLAGPIAISLSILFAILAFGLAWVERDALENAKLPPVLTYLGAALLFVGHFYVIDLSGSAEPVWPAYTAGLCALLTASAWFLRGEPVQQVYGAPLRRAGLWLMFVPLFGAISILEPALGAVTFAIAGVTYAADAAVRRILNLAYLSGGAFVVVIWAVLLWFKVEEIQAYTIPLGLGLVGLGWNERRRGQRFSYEFPTILGLLILMGSAFLQSIDGVSYAVLLLLESLAALAWGVRTRSRGYVRLGGLSLAANAIAQLGPGFVELPRWVQLGTIGGLLLGGGLAALFRREQLLAARTRLREEWRRWES